ncbi:gamma interferon responsive lysosomal thiol (GILT) reductase family protein [Artemisia annua]|uniref:Gamma interferon responsive lysosomal thiol (GILT) reductase family protein n=1 Tax=Artemisia annua TaxID=35608 RepID=A0A2U1LHU1_ARTAN|nr:gamma interferon responsive lysosomal thiol (GILT) reductase family protein [Artemisia annua]
MASYHKMLVAFFLLTIAKSYCDEDKVKVSLYYESLCPYCSDFIVNHLGKALYELNLVSIVDLRMVPWGNTQFGPNNTWICQHGPDECSIDIVEACAIDLLPNDGLSFKLIECIENLNLEGRVGEWRSCMNSLNIDQNPIMDCYQSGKGYNLELQFADETNNLNPPHRFVPWVVVNDHALQEDSGNFVTYICNAYTGENKPEACEQNVLETNSFKETNSSYQVSYRGAIEHSIPFNLNF